MGATTCNMAKFLSAIGLLFVAALALAAPTPTQNIVQLAAGIPDLSTLVTALKAGNLVTALSDPGPFTVFAPTNEAFAALPNGTLASLLEPKNIKQLQSILEYHVIPGAAVRAEDLKASQDVKTLEGQAVHINKISGSVTVQNAKVIKADVGATNGVVHVINSVLTPPTTFDSTPVHSTPVLSSDGKVYVGSVDHSLYAVNTDSSLFNANLAVSGVAVHWSRDATGDVGNCKKEDGNVTIIPGNEGAKGQLVASCNGSDGRSPVTLYCQVTASAGALSLQAHFTISNSVHDDGPVVHTGCSTIMISGNPDPDAGQCCFV